MRYAMGSAPSNGSIRRRPSDVTSTRVKSVHVTISDLAFTTSIEISFFQSATVGLPALLYYRRAGREPVWLLLPQKLLPRTANVVVPVYERAVWIVAPSPHV